VTSSTKTSGPGGAAWRTGSCESSWRLSAPSVLGAMLVAVVMGLVSAGSASAAVAGDTCANAAVRAQSNSAELPACRGYEMVSSPYKEGFPADPVVNLRFNDDGVVVSYASLGTFAGNQFPVISNRYHATRSAAGWRSASVAPSGEIYDPYENTMQAESADLSTSLWEAYRRGVPGDKFGYYLRGADGSMTRIGDSEGPLGPQAIIAGVSADLSHVPFNYGATAVYEHVGTGNSVPRTASVDNQGQAQGACFRRISPDGQVIVYSTGCPTGTQQVWARIGGSVSVWASGSECTRTAVDLGGACNGVSAATYEGAAVDGSRVFFTTRQQLVNGDTDTGIDLYACDIPAGVPAPTGAGNPCAHLTQVSGTASNAQVENVAAVSKDGSRMYFVAQGVLASNLGVGGVSASAGAHNLYLWERDGANPAGTVRFVAGLGGNDLSLSQMTPDGRYLLILTASKLVTSGPGADDDDAVDAYRYDAVTKAIVRVSTADVGSGGSSAFDVSVVAGGSSMAADGSTVIFNTAEALSAADINGVTDVYSWSADGRVSLISTGGGSSLGITPSGRDIFFATDAQMVAADRDFLTDIYDARVGGGFAAAQGPPPCSGRGCQGQPSQPPSLAGPSPAGPGSGGLGASEVPPAFSLRAVTAAQRRALAATGKVSLTVTANAPGTMSVRATATIGGRLVTAGSGRRVLAAAGKAAVTLALSKRARRQLSARGKLTVRVSVSHSKVALDRSVTLRLAKAKAKARRSATRAQVSQRPVGGTRGGRA
jgi:Tol biopolymer transport system component